MARFDERDTIFSRMILEPGSDRYLNYYREHPEYEVVDRAFREAPESDYSHREEELRFIDSTFALIASMRPQVRGNVASRKLTLSPGEAKTKLVEMARSLNASLSAATPSDSDFAYSIRGRGEHYGQDVPELPENTFVMVFEMDRDEILTAPDPRQSVEVVKAYLKAAVAALSIAAWIRSLGWDAVAHIDGESEVVLPPLAAKAGLGELGKHGLLVTKAFGSRVRLSAVTTDMPLETSPAVPVVPRGLADFCSGCGRCAEACPAGAIPETGRVNHEACFGMWKKYGTDCGICLAVCPFSSRSLVSSDL